MPRTTSELVASILEVDETIGSLEPFITAANQLVTEACLASSYTDERLELIERWLAAHYYCVRDPRTSSEGAGGLNVSYQQGRLGMVLQSTFYGQMALSLDTQGNLALLSSLLEKGKKKTTAGVSFLGSDVPRGDY